jgi:hypothetical protein
MNIHPFREVERDKSGEFQMQGFKKKNGILYIALYGLYEGKIRVFERHNATQSGIK